MKLLFGERSGALSVAVFHLSASSQRAGEEKSLWTPFLPRVSFAQMGLAVAGQQGFLG